VEGSARNSDWTYAVDGVLLGLLCVLVILVIFALVGRRAHRRTENEILASNDAVIFSTDQRWDMRNALGTIGTRPPFWTAYYVVRADIRGIEISWGYGSGKSAVLVPWDRIARITSEEFTAGVRQLTRISVHVVEDDSITKLPIVVTGAGWRIALPVHKLEVEEKVRQLVELKHSIS
jgi:hypothetical protein